MTRENQNQSVKNHGKVEEGSGLDVFMKNKALYLEFKVTHENLTKEKMKEATIYFKHIRRNIDRAMTTKILIAHKMFIEFDRQKYVRQAEVHQHCQEFFKDYRYMCGKDYFEFDIFLRHFPDTFQIYRDKVLLRDIDMKELRKRYRAIILRPHALFNQGKLPIRLDTSFRVYFINTTTYGDHVAGLLYRNEPRVAVDLEGYNLGTYGIITLVQVAVSTDRVYIFDTLKCPYFLKKGLLRKILESDKITKVFHSLAGDAGNLCRQFNITLRNVFDTQVAFFTLQQKYPDLRLSYNATDGWSGWQISLNELMALYNIDGNQVKGEVKYLYRKNPNLWSYRPLCPVLLHYAGEDVNMLLRLQDAMNNHPIFKLDTKAILRWTQKNIQKQSQMALTIAQIAGPWKMPYTPQPRSVIRHEQKPWLSQSEWDKQREGVYNESISRRQYMARCNDLIQNAKNIASCKLTNSTTTTRQPTISHYNRSKREMIDVSSALAETYLSNSDSINSYIRNPSDPYIHNPSDPYIENPSDSYIQNPGSSRENACLLVVTVGLFFILIFIFWKESSSFFKRYFKRTW